MSGNMVIIPTKLIHKSPKSDYKVMIPTKLINKAPESDYKVIIPAKLTNKCLSTFEKMMIVPTKINDGSELFITTPEVILNSPNKTPNGPKLIELGRKTPLKTDISSRNKNGLKIYRADPENLFSGTKTRKLLMKPNSLLKETKNTLKETRRTSDKKLLMPPLRPQKLNIPTPKCTYLRQNANNPNTKTGMQMTPSEVKQYCEWVSGKTVKSHTKVQEASLVQQTTNVSPKHTLYASAGYIPRALPDLITYPHPAAGYPIKQTWIRAIKQGHYIGCPGLTAERVHKFLTPKVETAMGHMHKVKQGTKSTKSTPTKAITKSDGNNPSP